MIHVYDLGENADASLGIGWYRANWMPDSKSVVANGLIGRERVMVRMSLALPGKVIEQSTDYEARSRHPVSWDGKEIIFIARRPRGDLAEARHGRGTRESARGEVPGVGHFSI